MELHRIWLAKSTLYSSEPRDLTCKGARHERRIETFKKKKKTVAGEPHFVLIHCHFYNGRVLVIESLEINVGIADLDANDPSHLMS